MAEKSSTAEKSTENPFLVAMAQEAREAGLHYYMDDRPGIVRERAEGGFKYVNPDGSEVAVERDLARIKRLAIPPAWENVWICPSEDGHIQATGRDARGRKQYRYHPRWRQQRDENKFARMLEFGRVLPAVREKVAKDLELPGMPRPKVLATVVRLLETTLIRVGNDEYARENRSYGLTTMRNRHVDVNGAKVTFSFRGKSGKKHKIDVHDRQLARIVKRCQDLPGQELFAYEEEDGTVRDVTSEDVNQYLREVTGSDFTAKDFRTWAGTVLAAVALREFEEATSQTQAKKNIVSAVEAVSKLLGNTPAVCRKCYVHPEVLNAYLEGTTLDVVQQKVQQSAAESFRGLKPDEAAIMALLARRLREREAHTTTRKHERGT